MIQFHLLRGIIVVAVGIVFVVTGASLFDNSYESVESLIKIKHGLIEDQTILRNQLLNSTISPDILTEHNVILVHVKPASDSIKFLAVDPSGQTFEKESKDGFVYHIVDKQSQPGNYIITIYNQSDEPISVSAIVGKDPYLSGQCDPGYELQCNVVHMYIGFVMVGIIAFIVGALLIIIDLRKQRKLHGK